MKNVVRAALVALTVAAAAVPAGAQQAAVATTVKKAPHSPEPVAPRRGFNVVLLVGDMIGPGYHKPIPEVALRALADIRDFLPYKGYSLLDTQWIVGGTSSPAVTRLRGLDNQDYELELRASHVSMPGPTGLDEKGMSVRFVLRDTDGGGSAADSGRTALHPKEVSKGDLAAAEMARELFQLERERTDLEFVVTKGRSDVEIGMKSPVEVARQEAQLSAVNRRIAELKQSLGTANAKAAGRTVIDTSFRLADGETIVVGTSKMKGGSNALIALLTATTDRPKGSTK
jgi:hypothetical protein